MKKMILIIVAMMAVVPSQLTQGKEDKVNQFEVRTMTYTHLNENEAIPVKGIQMDIDGEQVNILTDLAHETYIINDNVENGENYIIFKSSGKIEKVKKGSYDFTYENEFLNDGKLASLRSDVLDLLYTNENIINKTVAK